MGKTHTQELRKIDDNFRKTRIEEEIQMNLHGSFTYAKQ